MYFNRLRQKKKMARETKDEGQKITSRVSYPNSVSWFLSEEHTGFTPASQSLGLRGEPGVAPGWTMSSKIFPLEDSHCYFGLDEIPVLLLTAALLLTYNGPLSGLSLPMLPVHLDSNKISYCRLSPYSARPSCQYSKYISYLILTTAPHGADRALSNWSK